VAICLVRTKLRSSSALFLHLSSNTLPKTFGMLWIVHQTSWHRDCHPKRAGCLRTADNHVGAPKMQMEVTKTELATKSQTFRDAEREQNSILAPLERVALRGLARQMPRWVSSDHLSVLGFVGMI